MIVKLSISVKRTYSIGYKTEKKQVEIERMKIEMSRSDFPALQSRAGSLLLLFKLILNNWWNF